MEQFKREVIAHNDAADSGNPMHDDEAARAMGYKAALVPGVTVYGYMTHGLVSAFGEKWLTDGSMTVQFRRPVFAGDRLELVVTPHENFEQTQVVDLAVIDPDGVTCVTGQGSLAANDEVLGHEHPRTYAKIPDRKSLPESKRPPTRETFEEEPLLGSITAAFPQSAAKQFLSEMQEDQEIYTHAVHPSWILRQANIVVDRNIAVGPWIHTESAIQNLGLLEYDQAMEVRAEAINLFEKKGHAYVDLDVAMLAGGSPEHAVMRVMHRAIYKVAQS